MKTDLMVEREQLRWACAKFRDGARCSPVERGRQCDRGFEKVPWSLWQGHPDMTLRDIFPEERAFS